MSYKVICAWCGVHITGNPAATTISHGICGDCLRQQLAGIKPRPLPPIEKALTCAALHHAAGDVGCDWLSSRGNGGKVDLTEVCG